MRTTSVAWLVLAWGCAHEAPAPTTPVTPPLSPAQIAQALPARVKDRQGWADDIAVAIRLTQKEPTAERVCAVVAVIGQESGFQADPVVADLPGIVKRGLEEKLARLGPARSAALGALLAMEAPGGGTFASRIGKLETERDLDRLFRDLRDAVKRDNPGGFAVGAALAAVFSGGFDELNPVTTAGSMQVKVDFAQQLEPKLSGDEVRELLYTRGGGVRFGTARLIGYPAAYDDVVFRFADYNAGRYASRNAALQQLVEDLTGRSLANDGDLLLYDDKGAPRDEDSNSLQALLAFGEAHGLSSWTVRRDVKKEKTVDFERTDTWKAVRAAWSTKTQRPPPYAQVPEVSLSSPKLSKPRTTAWFASSVKQRYTKCRAALAPPSS
jgi:hypothetical protein